MFNRLEVDKNVDVFLVQDSICFAKITCGKNLLDGITTEVIDGKLYITNKNRCNWARSFKNKFVVEVHCPDLVWIKFATSGDLIMLNQFKIDSLYLESNLGAGSAILNLDARIFYGVLHTGVADLTVKGKLQVGIFYVNGQGFIDTRELENSYAYVRVRGSNDCKVRVKDHLDAEIESEANIYYYGNPPVVNLKNTGTGKLIKAD